MCKTRGLDSQEALADTPLRQKPCQHPILTQLFFPTDIVAHRL